MRAVQTCAAFALAFSAGCTGAQAASAGKGAANPLVGAWTLVAIDEVAPDGTTVHYTDLKGNLIYTPTGRISVQVMYPDDTVTNDYTQGGYEASFGSYVTDQASHQVTQHIEGAVARKLVGTTLVRHYRIEGRTLKISSVRPDERWVVTWQRY